MAWISEVGACVGREPIEGLYSMMERGGGGIAPIYKTFSHGKIMGQGHFFNVMHNMIVSIQGEAFDDEVMA